MLHLTYSNRVVPSQLSIVWYTNERKKKDRKEETDKEAKGVSCKSLWVISELGLEGMTRQSGHRDLQSSERNLVGVKALGRSALLCQIHAAP